MDVQWTHSIKHEADFIDELRAQLLGVVTEHVVKFDADGFCLTDDEDPRLLSGLNASSTSLDFPDFPGEVCACTDHVSPFKDYMCCSATTPFPSAAWPSQHSAHVADAQSQPVPPVACTASSPSSQHIAQLPSALHQGPHLLPLYATFHFGRQSAYNTWARQLNVLAHKCDKTFTLCYKDGSLSNLGRRVGQLPGPEPWEDLAPTEHSTPATCKPDWMLGPSSFSDIRLRITAAVDIFPTELDRPEVRQQQLSGLSWLSGWRVGGSVCSEAQQDRYALLATDRHLQLRTMRRGWSINELISDIVGVVPRVRSVRFLVHRLAHLPAVQVVVTTREAPTTDSAVPLDFREVQGRICTLNIGPGTSNALLARRAFEECPATHSPQQDFQILLPDGGVLQVFPALDDWPDFVRGVPGVPALWPQPDPEAEDDVDHVNFFQLAPGQAPVTKSATCQGDDTGHHIAMLPLTPPRCPVSEGDPPSLLKRRLSGEPAKASGDQWQLHPRTLSEPRYSGVNVAYMTWGRPDDSTRHLFTVFDSRRHVSAITSNDAARIAEFAQRAIVTAPSTVRALQFLTVPVPGLPLPQVVLTFVDDPADSLAIPWDCREIGLPIRTVPHLPGEQLRQAAANLQNTVRHEPDLALRISDGRLLVLDVAGLVQEALPVVLTETQWLRVELPIWNDASAEGHHRLPSMLESLRLSSPAGLQGSLSTTSTTTGMLSTGVNTFRIRLFGDGKEVSHDVQTPCPQLDLVLCLLLGKLQQLSPPTQGPANVMMAKAQPPPTNGVQEVLFLSHPAEEFDSTPVFIDGRPQGGSLILAALPRLTTTEHAVPDFFRGNGCFALINGAPAHLAQRTVMPGDFVQLGCSGIFVPHTAATAIVDQLPQTDAYGYMFAAQLHAGDTTFLQRVRARRRAAQVWQPLENVITIIGPAHGPVRLRMDCLFVPTVDEVREALIPMTEFNSMRLAMAYTTAQIPGAALFVTVCPQSDLRTVLLPLATSPAHFIVLMVPSLAEDLGYLPLDPQQRILWTYERWRHGQILAIFTLPASMARPVHRHIRPPRPRPGVTYSPGGRVVPRSGTSLVQIRHQHSNNQDRCRRAAQLWKVSDQQPCVDGLPREVHLKLKAIPVAVGAEATSQESDSLTPPPDSHQSMLSHDVGRFPLQVPTLVLSRDPGCNTLADQGPDCHSTLADAKSVPFGPAAAPVGSNLCVPTPFGRRRIPRPGCDRTKVLLQDCIPESIPKHSACGIAFGLEPEALDFVFKPFGREAFDMHRPACGSLHPIAARFLAGLPDATPDAPLEALQLYVDGSFKATKEGPRSGWSIVAIGLQRTTWCWAGHLSTACAATGDHTTLGVSVASAYDTELAGLVYALATCQAHPCPAAIFYDCQSAGQLVQAEAAASDQNALTEAASAIHHLLWLQNRLPAFGHIKSHEGHPLNELVDSIAKTTAAQVDPSPLAPELHWASTEGALAWLWIAAGIHHSVPRPDAKGILRDDAQTVCPNPSPSLRDVVPSVQKHDAQALDFNLRIATYNPLTIASHAQRESLHKQFRHHGLHLIGLQETRTEDAGRRRQGAFHVLSSPALKGEGGVQLWLAADAELGCSAKGPVHWDSASMAILVSGPQLLLVTARAGGSLFAIVVGHAPTNRAPVQEKESWWHALGSAVARSPPRATLILCLDANARLAKTGQAYPDNAHFTRQFLTAHNLSATSARDGSGEELATWYSPSGSAACIDYVCVASEFAAATSPPRVLHAFEGQVAHDHRPVQISLRLKKTGVPAPDKIRLDADYLRTPQGRQLLQDIYRRLPPIPWQTDVDTHLSCINTHLQSELLRLCPKRKAAPRSPVTSEATWDLIRHRRELKRLLFSRRTDARQRLLSEVFAAWARKQAASPRV